MKRFHPVAPLLIAAGVLGAGAALAADAPAAKPAEAPAAKPAASPLAVPFIEGRPFAEVLRRAGSEKKPIMVDLYATWCGPCKLLDKAAFADAELGAWAKKTVVAAKIDAEKGEGRRLARRYSVNSFPTVLFLDSSGSELDRLTGAYDAASFRQGAETILGRRSQLQLVVEQIGREWSVQNALSVIPVLAQRNDLPRLRPIILRLVREDVDVERPETPEALGLLAYLEDLDGGLSPVTADLVSSFLPRLGDDPRRAMMATYLARDLARAGEAARVRVLVDETLRAVGASSPLAPDLYAALAQAQQKAGRAAEAASTFAKALKAGESGGKPQAWMAGRRVELAAVLAADAKAPEAEATLRDALPGLASDAPMLASAARVWLVLKKPEDAVSAARRAVLVSQGEDPRAQAALGASLLAAGDRKGAAASFAKALEFAPDDAEIRRESAAAGKKKG